jgi:hypothetical protein
VAITSFRDPQFLWVEDFLKMFFLRNATVARQDTFLLVFFCRATSTWRFVPLRETANLPRHPS